MQRLATLALLDGPAAPRRPAAADARATGHRRAAASSGSRSISSRPTSIVRDNRDQFVADLTKDEFEVYEDGVKQDIASLTLVHGGRVHNLQAPPPPPAQEGIILPPSRPRNDAAGRIFLIFVDDLHLDFRNTGRIRDLFKQISKTWSTKATCSASSRPARRRSPSSSTYDRKILDEAIKKITGDGLKPTDIIQGAGRRRGADRSALPRARRVLDRLRHAEEPREGHNRRKAVIWVSNGYDFNPFEESRLGEDPVFGGRFGQTREEGRQRTEQFNQRRSSSPKPTWRASWPS